MCGFIQLHRKLKEWEWYTDIPCKTLFIHCLLSANFKEKKWRGIDVKKGSFISSIQHLSDESGLSVQEVRTALKKLESTGEISKESTNKNTIITVCKYDDYQQYDKEQQQTNNKRTTNNQQTINKQSTTTNKDNNKNKGNNDNNVCREKTHTEIDFDDPFAAPSSYKQDEEKKEKSCAKKEKKKHTFPDIVPQKSYNVHDKRQNKNIPFNVVSAHETINSLYPSGKGLAEEFEMIFGYKPLKEVIDKCCRTFVTDGIGSYYTSIRDIEHFKTKLLHWLDREVKFQRNNTGKSTNSSIDIQNSPLFLKGDLSHRNKF